MNRTTLLCEREAALHEPATRPIKEPVTLHDIEELDARQVKHFKKQTLVQPSLTRQLVSFQANKTRSTYRWYKYKEGFSAALVDLLLSRHKIHSGTILDPFAGSGTTMFVASALGMDADGIELLPIGQEIIETRTVLENKFTKNDFEALKRWGVRRPWKHTQAKEKLPELRITKGAYPAETAEAIEKYSAALKEENKRVQAVLRFALLCILESVSYTRKDGQYLRWDHRSGRRQGVKPFNKGVIHSFDQAICDKIGEISGDMENGYVPEGLFNEPVKTGQIHLYKGSCLDAMPALPAGHYDAILTSPPYCNRYDYTRTYALELALLGVDEKEIGDLRQQMLSCTVENRAKDLMTINPRWRDALGAVDRQELLQAILGYLESQKESGELNNNGIPRMVRGYFSEMACIIAECARVLKSGAPLFMVNDNVRYAGASVSVDMILSSIAEKLGFRVESILVLPGCKGNSSQQMGEHGREALRKCIYVWRKA